jgi:hypothetical protein
MRQDTAKALEETLARNLAKAERENATVYLQRIPPGSELATVAGALLVKPIVPHLDASREGLFTSVIPDNRCLNPSKSLRARRCARHWGIPCHGKAAPAASLCTARVPASMAVIEITPKVYFTRTLSLLAKPTFALDRTMQPDTSESSLVAKDQGRLCPRQTS